MEQRTEKKVVDFSSKSVIDITDAIVRYALGAKLSWHEKKLEDVLAWLALIDDALVEIRKKVGVVP